MFLKNINNVEEVIHHLITVDGVVYLGLTEYKRLYNSGLDQEVDDLIYEVNMFVLHVVNKYKIKPKDALECLKSEWKNYYSLSVNFARVENKILDNFEHLKKEEKMGKSYVLSQKGYLFDGDINILRERTYGSLPSLVDFRKLAGTYCDFPLIKKENIQSVVNFEFYDLEEKIVKTIFSLAKKSQAIDDKSSNFKICEDGTILVGSMMKKIKENLKEYKRRYYQFQNRPHFSKIELSIIEET